MSRSEPGIRTLPGVDGLSARPDPAVWHDSAGRTRPHAEGGRRKQFALG